MNKYEVLCLSSYYKILATGWSVGVDGLKFFQGTDVVAWFTIWDFWRLDKDE